MNDAGLSTANFRSNLWAWLLLVGGLVGSLVAQNYIQHTVEEEAVRHGEFLARQASRVTRERLEASVSLLKSTQAFLSNAPQAGRADFRRHVQKRALPEAHAGIESLGFVRAVPDAELSKFENRVRRDTSIEAKGYPLFAVISRQPSAIHYVVDYLELLPGHVNGNDKAFGEDLASLSPGALRRVRSRIGFIHQSLALVPGLRVIQNVVMGQSGRRSLLRCVRDVLCTSGDDTGQIHQLLERAGIPEKLYHRTGSLSGGQQQRVAVARALFQKPEALLADEPVSSIDPARARDTVDLLTRLSREDGLTLLMSLHNLELAREYFPRLIGLRGGRVIFDAAPSGLGPEAFESLYRLSRDELLADG